MKKEKFFENYEYIKENSNNFTDLNKEILINKPESIIVYRMILNIGQKQLCNKGNLSRGHLNAIERSKIKNLTEKSAKKYINIIKREFKNIKNKELNVKKLFERHKIFIKKGKIDTERAREIRSKVESHNNVQKGLRVKSKDLPENEFEKEIFNLLKKNNIEFELHPILKANNKSLIADFAIPNSKNPRIIIEVKQSKSTNIKRQYDLMHWYAIILDHKMRSIKTQNPKIKGVIILSSKNKPLEKLSPYIEAELIDTDKYFIDSNLHDLIDYIKK